MNNRVAYKKNVYTHSIHTHARTQYHPHIIWNLNRKKYIHCCIPSNGAIYRYIIHPLSLRKIWKNNDLKFTASDLYLIQSDPTLNWRKGVHLLSVLLISITLSVKIVGLKNSRPNFYSVKILVTRQ